MTADDERAHEAWDTRVALREFIQRQLDDSDRRYQERFAAQMEAIKKAESAVEVRFAGVNEFRAALADQQAAFVRTTTFSAFEQSYQSRHDQLAERIAALERLNAESAGRGKGVSLTFTTFAAVVAIVAAIIGVAFRLLGI